MYVVIHAEHVEVLLLFGILDVNLFVWHFEMELAIIQLYFFLQGLELFLSNKCIHLFLIVLNHFIKLSIPIIIFKARSAQNTSRLIINHSIFRLVITTATTCTSWEFFNFKYLLRLRCTFNSWVVDFIQTTFITHDLLHLFFRDESSMVAISVLGQVLSAVVSNMVLVHSLFFLFPIAHHFLLSLLQGHRRAGNRVCTHAAHWSFTRFSRVNGGIALSMRRHRSISWHRQFPLFHHFLSKIALHRLVILGWSINRNVAQYRWSRSHLLTENRWLWKLIRLSR